LNDWADDVQILLDIFSTPIDSDSSELLPSQFQIKKV
jgi:hypothetical protein